MQSVNSAPYMEYGDAVKPCQSTPFYKETKTEKEKKMSNIKKDDIVEFIYERRTIFGYVVKVYDSDAIGFIIVSAFDYSGKYFTISPYDVKNVWSNLKGYILERDILREENKMLKLALEKIAKMRNLNPNLQYQGSASCAESIFIDFYCKMGDIAIKALESTQMSLPKLSGE